MSVGPLDVGQRLDDGPWGGYQRWLVALVASTVVIDGADNQLLAICIPSIMSDWDVTRPGFAPVLASGLIGMMVGGAIAGLVGDRVGRKVALLGSVTVFGLLTLAAAFSTDLSVLAALRFLAGLGLGGAMPNAAALSSEFVPRRARAFAVTLTIVCVPLGGMVAAVVAELLLPSVGWRGLFAIGGLVPLVLVGVLIVSLPESPRFLARHASRHRELAAVLRRMGLDVAPDAVFVDAGERAMQKVAVSSLFEASLRRDTTALWVAYLTCMLAVYLNFNWVPSTLAGAGLAPYASRGLLVFNLGGVVGAIAGAVVIARLGSRLTMVSLALAAVVAGVVMAGMRIGPGVAATPLIALLGVSGCFINAVQTTMYALAAHIYPTPVRATGVGSAVAVGRVGGVLSTYAGEMALSSGGTPWFFGLIAASMGVAATALAAIGRHISPDRSTARATAP